MFVLHFITHCTPVYLSGVTPRLSEYHCKDSYWKKNFSALDIFMLTRLENIGP